MASEDARVRADLLALAKRSLGESLRAKRVEAGLRLTDVAAPLGMSPGYLSDLERGLKLPSMERLLEIAAALNTDVVSLLGSREPWAGTPPPSADSK